MAQPKRENYLNNRDMLLEIHRSKMSYSHCVDTKFGDYDIIINDINDLASNEIREIKVGTTDDGEPIFEKVVVSEYTISTAIENRVSRTNHARLKEAAKISGTGKSSFKDIDVFTPDQVVVSDLVFRVMTYDHIPKQEGRKKNPKTAADHCVRVNFPPFKHYTLSKVETPLSIVLLEDGSEAKEVCRSHWQNGKFSMTHGTMTHTLAKMLMLLVHRYSQRPNWRGYTYVDEMKGQSLLQLSSMALSFNEAKSENPFSYFTQTISNSFTKVFNSEKTHQDIRDDLLIEAGQNPSNTRMLDVEYVHGGGGNMASGWGSHDE